MPSWKIVLQSLVLLTLLLVMAGNGLMLLGIARDNIRRRYGGPPNSRHDPPPPPFPRDPEAMKLIYEYTKDAPQQQFEQARAVDQKMTTIFAAAGVVIGLAGFSKAPSRNGADTEEWVTILLSAGLVAFILTALFAVSTLWPRPFILRPLADTLWKRNRNQTVNEIRQILAATICYVLPRNEAVLGKNRGHKRGPSLPRLSS